MASLFIQPKYDVNALVRQTVRKVVGAPPLPSGCASTVAPGVLRALCRARQICFFRFCLTSFRARIPRGRGHAACHPGCPCCSPYILLLILRVWQVEQFKGFAPKVPRAEERLRKLITDNRGDRSAIQAKLQEWHDTGVLDVDADDAWESTAKKKPVKVRLP
jgi:hypothetical protein